jgi:hypothetical protein
MKIIDSDLFNLRGFKSPICNVVLDCTYLELIKEDAKILRPKVSNEKIKGNKRHPKRKERLVLIIGVTNPNGEFSEVQASIPFMNPLDASGILTIYPPDITLVPKESKIELLRYEAVPVK